MLDQQSFLETSVRVVRDVELGEPHLLADIYMPPESMAVPQGGFPVVQYQHGGAWTLGNKKSGRHPCENLARKGHVCVSTSYRLSSVSNSQLETVFIVLSVIMLCLVLTSSNATAMMVNFAATTFLLASYAAYWHFSPRSCVQHPDHAEDVAKSFVWVSENIARYGGNDRSIILMGHSAGGHLSSLLATNRHYVLSAGGDPSRIAGCVSVSGAYSDQRLKETSFGREILKSAFGDRPHHYDAFPIYHVGPDTPPFMLINCENMEVSLKRHTMDFHYTLRQAGVWSEVHYFRGSNHMNITSRWGDGEDNSVLTERIVEFIRKVCEDRQ